MKRILITSLILVMCFCSNCGGPSNRKRQNQSSNRSEYSHRPRHNKRSKGTRTVEGSSIVHMQKEGGVYKVPIKINGYNMNFIFDTGASSITMSSLEAAFLVKQGALTEDDILGEALYQIADGSTTSGTEVNLREVQIANKIIYDVRASIVDNATAPLLLGQSALAQFGKVVIDYDRNTIEFK